MSIRKRYLPEGWYPATSQGVRSQIESWKKQLAEISESALAGVVPHAGWYFSGRLAFDVIRRLDKNIDTLVIIGGHLPPRGGTLAAVEDEYETPLGNIEADLGLLAMLQDKMDIKEDRFSDNTVEIQLPLVKYLFPERKALALRAAPDSSALELGRQIALLSKKNNLKTAVIGSTDLTHYGSSYGFTPHGSGTKALQWVKDVNDKQMITALLTMQLDAALDLANRERSACSAGGACAAASFASFSGKKQGSLIDYFTSHDVYAGESFVGYGGIIYS